VGANGMMGELYNNVGGIGACAFHGVCDPTSGTPIPVNAGFTTSGVNFILTAGGRITGSVTATGTGTPVAGFVYIIDSAGNYVDYDFMDAAGVYLSVQGLPTGTTSPRSFRPVLPT
jgi:hypothetical protein